MLRRLFTFASAASLVLCAATVVLWVRSALGTDRVAARVGQARFTLRSVPGHLVLLGPPAAVAASGLPEPTFRRSVERLRNDEILVGFDPGSGSTWGCSTGSNALTLWSRDPRVPPLITPMLLSALEDPDRFVAAHSLLCWYYWRKLTPTAGAYKLPYLDAGQRETSHYGMRVRFSRAAGIDIPSDQIAALVDQWHSVLDRRVLAAPYSVLVPVLAASPAVWLGRRWRGRRRTKLRLRPACGYDLRATPGRCPECGAVLADPAPPV